MNDLHSLAYTDTYHNSSLGWDYHHNNGVLNIDRISLMPTAMNESAISLFSSPQEYCDDDFSTGYLEDALIEFTSKRRRLLQPCSDEQRKNNSNDDFGKSFWNFNFNPIWNHQPVENFYCMNHIERFFGLSETRTPEETKISESESPNSSSSSYKEAVSSKTIQVNLLTRDPKLTSPGTSGYYEKRKRRRRIVYPFAMVKPGGIEGEVTLKDINERMLMAPTRPVKHPVGDFACQPCVSSLQGSGLSGKAVVTLTRIHTLGRRGTITIIRTKG